MALCTRSVTTKTDWCFCAAICNDYNCKTPWLNNFVWGSLWHSLCLLLRIKCFIDVVACVLKEKKNTVNFGQTFQEVGWKNTIFRGKVMSNHETTMNISVWLRKTKRQSLLWSIPKFCRPKWTINIYQRSKRCWFAFSISGIIHLFLQNEQSVKHSTLNIWNVCTAHSLIKTIYLIHLVLPPVTFPYCRL
jgi:hypothetical protein